MADYALYQAIKSYIPTSEDQLEFQKGDVFQIAVESPFSSSPARKPGWLLAYNRRTRAKGYVPVESVKLLGSEVGKTIHHPSACGVEVSDMKLGTLVNDYNSSPTNRNLHHDFYFKPLYF